MTKHKKLALASAVAASIFGITTAEAHVSYHYDPATTDAPNSNGSVDAGAWTGGSPTAKGYVANLPVTWLANIHHNDTNYLVSSADAVSRGATAGYTLSSVNNKWTAGPGNTSWGNALDYGLIYTDVAGNLSIEIRADADLSSDFAPGFTLWKDWGDAGTGNKHQAWNFDANNPQSLGVTGITYLDHTATTIAGGVATLTFSNIEIGRYTLFIGGNGTVHTNQYYLANISVATPAAVPLPGAVWLFGSALALFGFGRRKTASNM